MTAVAFMIWNRSHASVMGVASLCVEARYASVRWCGAERLDRRFADLATWRAIASEVNLQLPAAPLPRTSAIANVLAGERVHDVEIQYLTQTHIDDSEPRLVAALLDAGLRSTTIPEARPDQEP